MRPAGPGAGRTAPHRTGTTRQAHGYGEKKPGRGGATQRSTLVSRRGRRRRLPIGRAASGGRTRRQARGPRRVVLPLLVVCGRRDGVAWLVAAVYWAAAGRPVHGCRAWHSGRGFSTTSRARSPVCARDGQAEAPIHPCSRSATIAGLRASQPRHASLTYRIQPQPEFSAHAGSGCCAVPAVCVCSTRPRSHLPAALRSPDPTVQHTGN